MLHHYRHLVFRPSHQPGISCPVTIRSAGHYQVSKFQERRSPRTFTQIYWVERGEIRYRRCGETFSAAAGEGFFFRTTDPHFLDVGETGASYWWVTFDGPLVGDWLAGREEGNATRHLGRCPSDLFHQIESLVGLPSPGNEKTCAFLGLELLLRFAGSAERSTPHEETRLSRKLQTLMEERYADPDFGVEKAAELLRCHRSTLYRIFVDQVGLTPSRYLQRYRLHAGLNLLRETPLTVDEVARASGFRDGNYFARVVRDATGESPRTFRQGASTELALP